MTYLVWRILAKRERAHTKHTIRRRLRSSKSEYWIPSKWTILYEYGKTPYCTVQNFERGAGKNWAVGCEYSRQRRNGQSLKIANHWSVGKSRHSDGSHGYLSEDGDTSKTRENRVPINTEQTRPSYSRAYHSCSEIITALRRLGVGFGDSQGIEAASGKRAHEHAPLRASYCAVSSDWDAE